MYISTYVHIYTFTYLHTTGSLSHAYAHVSPYLHMYICTYLHMYIPTYNLPGSHSAATMPVKKGEFGI